MTVNPNHVSTVEYLRGYLLWLTLIALTIGIAEGVTWLLVWLIRVVI